MSERCQIVLIIGGSWPSAYETAEDAFEAYQRAKKANFLINVAITCSENDPAACHVQIEGVLTHYKYLELPDPITLEFFKQLFAPIEPAP